MSDSFVAKDAFILEMRNLQDLINKDMEIKLERLEEHFIDKKGAGGIVKSDLMLSQGQYKKVLELMLDLEKKMDKRFLEAHHETANAIINALDVNSFKREMDDQVQLLHLTIDKKLDELSSGRMLVMEEEIEKLFQSVKDLVEAISQQKLKYDVTEANLKDTVELLKALDARFVNKSSELDTDIEDILKKMRNLEHDVLKKLDDIGGDGF